MHSPTDDLINLSGYPVLLSVAQVAEVLGCSIPSAKRRLYRREIAYIKDGRRVRVPREALHRYLTARLIPVDEQLS